MTLLAHLLELRRRLLHCLLVLVVLFLPLSYFANDIYHLLASPLLAVLPHGTSMIATAVSAPFLVPLETDLVGGLAAGIALSAVAGMGFSGTSTVSS
jgi:Sec-independent protein secretion pathway component TatC